MEEKYMWPIDNSPKPTKQNLFRNKLYCYKRDKTNVTFRLLLHPEYFITGIIINIQNDEDLDKIENPEFYKEPLETNTEYYLYGHQNPSWLITIELSNKELAYFADYEIDFETIIPTSYNPIRYFPNDIITPEMKAQVFKLSNGLCTIKDEGCTINAECCDHIIPRSKGGLTIIENLRAACNHCNLKKSNKMPF